MSEIEIVRPVGSGLLAPHSPDPQEVDESVVEASGSGIVVADSLANGDLRPNDPEYSEVFVIHDFSTMPEESGTQIAGSGGGFLRPFHFSSQEAAMERNYLGGGDQDGLTGAVDSTVTVVTHGLQAPHGMPKIWRHRLPAGMGTEEGTATGNGGGLSISANTAENLQFREVYEDYWIIYEGHAYEGKRVLQQAGYRMTQEQGADRRSNFFSLMSPFPQGSSGRRSAISDVCISGGYGDMPEDSSVSGYHPVTHITPAFGALPTVGTSTEAPHCSGVQQDDYSNWLTGAVRGWFVGREGNTCHSADSTFPQCVIQVGRWYRITRLLKLGTPDNNNGSLDVWLHDDQMNEVGHAFIHDVNMLSDIWDGESGFGNPNQGYINKTLWSHYHPGGGIQKPFTDYVSIADYYSTGVLF